MKKLPIEIEHSYFVPRCLQTVRDLHLVVDIGGKLRINEENLILDVVLGLLPDGVTPEQVSSKGLKYENRNLATEDAEWKYKNIEVRFSKIFSTIFSSEYFAN